MAASAQDLLMEVGIATATTLDANYTISDTTVTVASTSGWPTATGVTFAIDVVDANGVQVAGSYNEYVGTVATATSVSNVSHVNGTDRNYSAGATTRVYIPVSAERENRIVEWGTNEHNQDGTHSDVTADSVTVTDLTVTGDLTISGSESAAGWSPVSGAISTSTDYNKGNKEFELDTSADLSGTISPGMRFQVTRGTTPPTQCLDLESSSSQYASKSSPTGITFTDDFTCEAWIKLESYTGAIQNIVSRYSGNGWIFRVLTTGQLELAGQSTTIDLLTSSQSVPLNRWVHVAASLDMSGATGAIYIDGVAVPTSYTNGAATSITQAGNLAVGALGNGTQFFDGEIADVRVWSTIRTATQIRDNMNQQLVGNETNLVAYFKLDGDLNDSTANANNLTGSGGAVATTVDHPFNDTEYAIVTKVTSSQITVFTGTDYNIPNMTLNTPQYSSQKVPFGFPASRNKWRVVSLSSTTTAITVPNKVLGLDLSVPTGEWLMSANAAIQFVRATGTNVAGLIAISTSATDITIPEAIGYGYSTGDTQPYGAAPSPVANIPVTVTTQTVYYVMAGGTTSTATPSNAVASPATAYLHMHIAECAYL